MDDDDKIEDNSDLYSRTPDRLHPSSHPVPYIVHCFSHSFAPTMHRSRVASGCREHGVVCDTARPIGSHHVPSFYFLENVPA